MDDLAALAHLAEQAGLALRGGFHPSAEDEVPLVHATRPTRTLVLLGFTSRTSWGSFAGSPEAGDGRADPLDRWSRRTISGLAAEAGASALFPFEGPPWLPFQKWARRAETVFASPLGMLIHPDYGLWHSYRGALAFDRQLAVSLPLARTNPCEVCETRPCLRACPVGAFGPQGYDVKGCATHIAGPAGARCMNEGCLARAACPVGDGRRYDLSQTRFHMKAFLAARSGL